MKPEVQAILERHAVITWFEPPALFDRAAGEAAFRAYHEHARALAPERFSPVAIAHAAGGWPEFDALCERVREERFGWDWKFSALKPMCRDHSRARGWSMATADEPELIVKIREDAGVWNLRLPGLPDGAPASARFYKEYADLEVIDGIEWQLAEPACPLADNPFVRLLHVYATRYYPFHLGAANVTLFHFV